MLESSELITIRRLPDGPPQPVTIASRAEDRLTLKASAEHPNGFETGALVEINCPEGFYLGEIAGRQKEEPQIVVAVEHFVDRAALAEIESAWKPAEGG